MDIIVATSRGRPLQDYFTSRPNTIMEYRPGASTEMLTHVAEDKMKKLPTPRIGHKHHVYFLSGLCDLTRRDRDKDTGYDEFTFMHNVEEADSLIERIHESSSAIITQYDAIPIYCTIAPMDISKWNHHRLSIGKTSYLLHYNHYQDMQENLINSTVFINHSICNRNAYNNMDTPRISHEIIYKPNARRPTYRMRYSNLSEDGCHPTEDVNCQWRINIDLCATTNRRNSNAL